MARRPPSIRLAGRVRAGAARTAAWGIGQAPKAFDALSDDAGCKFYAAAVSAILVFPNKIARTSRESRLLIPLMT
jgi:hypothetical protein